VKLKRGLAAVLISSSGLVAPALCLALAAAPSMAAAQQANDSTGSKSSKSNAPSEIVVTGSAIKRLNCQTPSPIDVVSSQQLQQSGFDTLSAVLNNITANGAGTLSNNNSVAFAGGASGVALRGLTVGATLTLVDGHRLAPYPLSDDGERPFVDVQSIPFGAVERVEVLKDGASAVYGSDAIAGVVNIILKKQITGIDMMAEGGDSQHGGGATEHFAISMGKGDLGIDGYNAFVTAEYRNQEAVYLTQRAYQSWGSLNYTSIGGNDLRGGAPSFLNANQPATMTPYLVNPDGSFNFLGTGCNTAAMAAAQCTFPSGQKILNPTRNIDVLAGFTKDFANGWEAKLRVSFFDSRGQQSTGPLYGLFGSYNWYPGASFGGFVSNLRSGVVTPGVGAIADYSMPANYMGSGSQAGAYLQGVIPQLGVPTNDVDSRTYRAALDVTGKLLGWDVTASAGFSEVVTGINYQNFVNFDTLYTDLISGAFSPLGGNSAAEMSRVAPNFSYTATNKLAYGEIDATRKVMDLPGGDLSLAAGATVIYKDLNNPGADPVLNGTVGGTFSTYASGAQTDIAEYLEADATLLHNLEINAAVRDDWYDTYGNSLTPKVGVKWKVFDPLTFRGTFAKGFRAPSAAESGKSSTLFSLGTIADPVLCGTGLGQVPAACSAEPGFAQQPGVNLKPETSTSFTGGAVIEPIHGWSTSIDYYHIKIANQIVTAAELPSYDLTSSCQRGPNLAIPGVVTGYDSHGAPILGTAVPLAGPIDACMVPYVNAQSTSTDGLDIQSQYSFSLGKYGDVTLGAEWTHLISYKLTAPNGDVFQLAGTHGPSGISGDTGNPRDRINASVTYNKGPFTVTASGYWISSFSVTDPSASNGGQNTCAEGFNGGLALAGATVGPLNSQYCRVHAFTSINLDTKYRFNQHVTLGFSVNNLFDSNAPFDAETYGGSLIPYNPSMHEDGVVGRFFRASVEYKF
jgi:iron complex outermembrane recepter protein